MDDESVTNELQTLAACAVDGVIKRMKDEIAAANAGRAEEDNNWRESMQREIEGLKAQLAAARGAKTAVTTYCILTALTDSL